MKHLTIIIGLLFFSLFATMQRAGAQRQDSAAAEQKDRPYPSVHYLAEPCARWRGDSLEVRFSGEVAGRLKGSESLHLIPIYISGGDTIRYPEVGYFTSSEAKYYKRREALSDTKTDGTVRVLDRKGHSEVDYRESMLVPQTFAGRVQLQQLLHTCCEEHLLASEAIAVPERAVTVPDTVYTTEILSQLTISGSRRERAAVRDERDLRPAQAGGGQGAHGHGHRPYYLPGERLEGLSRLREQPAGVVAYRQNPVARGHRYGDLPHPFRLDYGLCFAGGYLQA